MRMPGGALRVKAVAAQADIAGRSSRTSRPPSPSGSRSRPPRSWGPAPAAVTSAPATADRRAGCLTTADPATAAPRRHRRSPHSHRRRFPARLVAVVAALRRPADPRPRASARAANAAGQLVPGPSQPHQGAEPGEHGVADPTDLTELVDAREPAVLGAPVEDPLGEHRTDPGQRVELGQGCRVDVDQQG
jgi:hypothetical protein